MLTEVDGEISVSFGKCRITRQNRGTGQLPAQKLNPLGTAVYVVANSQSQSPRVFSRELLIPIRCSSSLRQHGADREDLSIKLPELHLSHRRAPSPVQVGLGCTPGQSQSSTELAGCHANPAPSERGAVKVPIRGADTRRRCSVEDD